MDPGHVPAQTYGSCTILGEKNDDPIAEQLHVAPGDFFRRIGVERFRLQ